MQSLVRINSPSEQSIYSNLLQASQEGIFYQKVGSVLVKVNPNSTNPIEIDRIILLAKLLDPITFNEIPSSHLYRYGESIRRNAIDQSGLQGVVLRGCSGSGKSEALKALLEYYVLTESPQYISIAFQTSRNPSRPIGTSDNPFLLPPESSVVCKRLCASLALLTAFTSAATDKNCFSSRAMKFISIKYGNNGKLSAIRARCLFAEMLRTNTRDPIQGPLFIQALVMKGCPKLTEYGVPGSLLDNYNNSGFGQLDYQQEYLYLEDLLLNWSGLSSDDWESACKVVAAVCLLQGVTLLGSDSTLVSSSTKTYVTQAETLLGLEAGSIFGILMKKPDERIGRPSGSMTETKPIEAKIILETATSYLMSKTLSFLLNQLSVAMPLDPSEPAALEGNVIHLLDPTGWDRAGLNQNCGLLHLVNNYIEERLNNIFIQRVFNDEIAKYAIEGIQLEAFSVPDWIVHQDLLDKPMVGIMALLDETCLAPRSEEKAFVDKVFTGHSKSKMVKAGGPRSKATVFIIKHSFADISYDCEGFIAAQKCGHLSSTTSTLFKTSSIAFISGYDDIGYDALPPPKDDNKAANVIRVKSEARLPVSSTYFWNRSRDCVNRLHSDFNLCKVFHFILCFNLNLPSITGDTTMEVALQQIRGSGLDSLISMAQKTFSMGQSYQDFYNRFRFLVPFVSPNLPLTLQTNGKVAQPMCEGLLKQVVSILGITNDLSDWPTHLVYGNNQIFFKEQLSSLLEERRFTLLQQRQNSALKIQSAFRMFCRWRDFRKGKKSTIILQSGWRRNKQRRRFKKILKSAGVIKSSLMMIIQRRQYCTIKNAVMTIKRKLLGKMIQLIRYKRLARATRALQNIARGFILRKSALQVFAAVLLLQRKARAFVRRRRILAKRLAAAIVIQHIYRGYQARVKHYSIVQVLRVRREQRVAEKVVRKLQALWRAKMVVSRFQEVFNATINLQCWIRKCIQLRRYHRILRLALWLQSHARRLKALKLANSLKVNQMLALEKGSLAAIFLKEVSPLHGRKLTECVLSSGLYRQGRSKFERNLVAYDLYFDLSFAYPEGWLSSLLTFYHNLQQEAHRKVIQIAVGSQHTVLVDDKWDVYTFGLGDLGQLGHSSRTSFSYPHPIELLQSILSNSDSSKAHGTPGRIPGSINGRIEVKDVSCGRDHSLLLTASGQVYSWGDNRRGQLGHSNFESISTPRLVAGSKDKPLRHVTQISCGAYHSACLADPGTLYTWGAGEILGRFVEGERSIGSTRSSMVVSGMTIMDSIIGDELFHRRVVYSKQYRVYDAHADIVDCCEPAVLPFFSRKKVRLMCVGETHITVQCADSLYAWGKNNYGQLGTGNNKTKDQRLPTKVFFRALTESEVNQLQLYSGGRHMMLLIKGKMWLWGWNKYGQIGDGGVENIYRPTRIHIGSPSESPSPVQQSRSLSPKVTSSKTMSKGGRAVAPLEREMGDNYIRSAVLGWRHSVVMTAKHHVYGWGVINFLEMYTLDPVGSALAPEEQPIFEVFLIPTLITKCGSETIRITGASGSSMSFCALDNEVMEPAPTLQLKSEASVASSRTKNHGSSRGGVVNDEASQEEKSSVRTTSKPWAHSLRHSTQPSKHPQPRFETSSRAFKLTRAPVSLNYNAGELIAERFRELGRWTSKSVSASPSRGTSPFPLSVQSNEPDGIFHIHNKDITTPARGHASAADRSASTASATLPPKAVLKVDSGQLLRIFTPKYVEKRTGRVTSKDEHELNKDESPEEDVEEECVEFVSVPSASPPSSPSRSPMMSRSKSPLGSKSPGGVGKTKSGVLQNYVSSLAPASLTMPSFVEKKEVSPSSPLVRSASPMKNNAGTGVQQESAAIMSRNTSFAHSSGSSDLGLSFHDQMRELGLLRGGTQTSMNSASRQRESIWSRMGLQDNNTHDALSAETEDPLNRLKNDLMRMRKL
eukprot:scaffold369_cov177-Ochromonas_danica.AAC.36